MDYVIHDAANVFPMMLEARLSELKSDILSNGQRETIKLVDNKIIDGRNRYAACLLAEIEPLVETITIDDPWAYVWSLNGERRDLTTDQRYLFWKDCSEHSEAWQAEKQRIIDDSKAAMAKAKVGNDNAVKDKTTSPQVVGDLKSTKDKKQGSTNATSTAKATQSKTNRGTVERMDSLSKNRLDLAEKVKMGELPAATAIREMKTEAAVEKLENIATVEAKKLEGVYDVIVIDPPWPMEKIKRDERPNQTLFD